MKKIKIVFALSYSHLSLYRKVEEQFPDNFLNIVYVFYDLDPHKAEKYVNIKDYHLIKPYTVNKRRFLTTAKEVKAYTSYLDKILIEPLLNILNEDDEIKVIQFNEKNLAFQYFFQKINETCKNVTLEYIDEGFASYVSYYFKDYVASFIYPLITKFLWGWPFFYFRRGGTHQGTSVAYLRALDLLTEKISTVQYRGFTTGGPLLKFNPNSKMVLLISSPLSEYNLVSIKTETKAIREIISSINRFGLQLEIKLHPRENENKFDTDKLKNVFVIKNELLAEELDFSKYSFVINYGSSVVLDLVSIGYPIDRIITIPKSKTSKDMTLLKRTNMLTSMSRFESKDLNVILAKYYQF